MELGGVLRTLSLPLLPNPLSTGVVVLVWVPFMSRINLLDYNTHNCLQKKKKTFRKQQDKKGKYECTMNTIPLSLSIK